MNPLPTRRNQVCRRYNTITPAHRRPLHAYLKPTLEASASSGTLARPFLVCQASMLGLAANVWQLSLLLRIAFLVELVLRRELHVQKGGFVCLVPLVEPCVGRDCFEEGSVHRPNRATPAGRVASSAASCLTEMRAHIAVDSQDSGQHGRAGRSP